jgi:hypothetical protein
MTPIKSFTRLVNKILGKESTYSQQDMIVVEQALTELEELKEFISDIFTDKELNQWLFDNRINLFITLCGHILRIKKIYGNGNNNLINKKGVD